MGSDLLALLECKNCGTAVVIIIPNEDFFKFNCFMCGYINDASRETAYQNLRTNWF